MVRNARWVDTVVGEAEADRARAENNTYYFFLYLLNHLVGPISILYFLVKYLFVIFIVITMRILFNTNFSITA